MQKHRNKPDTLEQSSSLVHALFYQINSSRSESFGNFLRQLVKYFDTSASLATLKEGRGFLYHSQGGGTSSAVYDCKWPRVCTWIRKWTCDVKGTHGFMF